MHMHLPGRFSRCLGCSWSAAACRRLRRLTSSPPTCSSKPTLRCRTPGCCRATSPPARHGLSTVLSQCTQHVAGTALRVLHGHACSFCAVLSCIQGACLPSGKHCLLSRVLSSVRRLLPQRTRLSIRELKTLSVSGQVATAIVQSWPTYPDITALGEAMARQRAAQHTGAMRA